MYHLFKVGSVTNELLRAMSGTAFIGKNAITTRELRRKRERKAKRERILDPKKQNSRGF